MTILVDFCSRECKEKIHKKCCGSWYGLNTNIICNCMCHNKKLRELAEVVEPEANTTYKTQSSKEQVQDD